jgi:serine/threonine protein kinase
MISLHKTFKVAVLSALTLAAPIGQIANALPPGDVSASADTLNGIPIEKIIAALNEGKCTFVADMPYSRSGFVGKFEVIVDGVSCKLAQKTYSDEGAAGDKTRFSGVVDLFRQVEHPCVARILHATAADEEHAPVLYNEWFENGSLDAHLKTCRNGTVNRRLNPTEKVIAICCIVNGLLAIHTPNPNAPFGLFHGNLKPSDILFDRDYHAHITDATTGALEDAQVIYAGINNNPRYTPNDRYQLIDRDFDINNGEYVQGVQKVDAFSMGLIMCEILTGVPVISPELNAGEAHALVTRNFKPSVSTSIKPKFRTLIERCCDSDPMNRRTISEIWNVLKQINFQVIDGVDADAVRARLEQLGININ